MKYTSINFLPDAKQSPIPGLPIRLFTSQHQLFTGASHLMLAKGKETQSPSISYFAISNRTWNQTSAQNLFSQRKFFLIFSFYDPEECCCLFGFVCRCFVLVYFCDKRVGAQSDFLSDPGGGKTFSGNSQGGGKQWWQRCHWWGMIENKKGRKCFIATFS